MNRPYAQQITDTVPMQHQPRLAIHADIDHPNSIEAALRHLVNNYDQCDKAFRTNKAGV
jgi:hypothetical protein